MVVITYDPSCEMMAVFNGDECIFNGNEWDFDKSPTGLAEFLTQLGIKCGTQEVNCDRNPTMKPSRYKSVTWL